MVVDGPRPDDREVLRSPLISRLSELGIESVLLTCEADLDSIVNGEAPDLALLDISRVPVGETCEMVRRCSSMGLPVIALVPEEQLAGFDSTLGVDDFILSPPRFDELAARAGRVISRAGPADEDSLVRAGDLVINPANYEVTLKGRRVHLRFKEYELLLLLATNPGRVFSRESLLKLVWSYDYYGGTRTVDVHVRRLRSKLQDSDHSVIETVWNVGYRFRDSSRSP